MKKEVQTSNTQAAIPYDHLLAAGRKILRLPINRYWFDMIASGEKREEYREMKKHWVSRLVSHVEKYNSANCLMGVGYETIFKQYDYVEFKNGYGYNVPTMLVECEGIRIGKPKMQWCVDAIDFDRDNGYYDDCFIISLGRVLYKCTAQPCS